MKKTKAVIALLILVAATTGVLVVPHVLEVLEGLGVGLCIIFLTSSGYAAYESPVASVWTRRILLSATMPLGLYMVYWRLENHMSPWFAEGIALNVVWLLATTGLDKGQLGMGGVKPKAKVAAGVCESMGSHEPEEPWHPQWCPTQLEWDVLRAHHTAEDYRILGTKLGHSGVPARVACMHWLIKEAGHTAGHHASQIKRLCCTSGPSGLGLKVWQSGDARKALQVQYEPGGDWAVKRTEGGGREDLVITGAQREQMDLLHWVSRGETL